MRKRPLSRRRRRLRWTVAILVVAALAGGTAAVFVYKASGPRLYAPGEEHAEITRSLVQDLPPEAPKPVFVDATQPAGLSSYRAFSGERTSQLPEDMGPGAAWGDYDADGDEDLFLVSAGGALDLPPDERAASELYENLGNGGFRRSADFPDMRIVGMGAAWGDYDGDGRLDLVVTGYDTLLLYRNAGDRFVRDARFQAPRGFWAGAAWGDYDNDRDLDLYVCGYVRYLQNDSRRASASQQYGQSVPYTLNPASFEPERNLLYRNDGTGKFTEVGKQLHVDNPQGRSLSALWHDFDDDGWLDLYVANDISDNALFWNRGGKFEEIGAAAWVADYRGAMGLAAGDWNRDGDDDLFITHWIAQENALYANLAADRRAGTAPAAPAGHPRFTDEADAAGVGYIALQFVGWGTEFADFDADGWLDLVVANGSTFETEEAPKRLLPQEPFLLWNRRGEHFFDLAPQSPALAQRRVGRGLAVADFDNDGDLDVLMVCRDQNAVLLRNDMQTGNWLVVRLRSRARKGGPLHGRGDGARLVVHAGGATLRRAVTSASYVSQSSRVVHFGLGAASRVEDLEVHWLGGGTDTYRDLGAGSVWEITEGDPVAKRLPARAATTTVPGSEAAVASSAPPTDARTATVRFWEEQRAAMQALKVEKDVPKAIRCFEAALALDSKHEDSRYYLGNCLAMQGDLDGALAQFEELTRINPQSHRGFKRWGTLRAMFASSPADFAAAEKALERALAINPEETGSLLVLGEIALLGGRPADAERRLALACRTNPRAVGGFFLRGYVAWKAGQPDQVRQRLAEARGALGKEWKPAGGTSEGDVLQQLHTDATPLSRFWQGWDGSDDPSTAFASLDAHLRTASAAKGR